MPNGYARRSDQSVEDVYDQAGTLGNDVPRNRRNDYPYGDHPYWYGHDADVERWGNLLENPYQRLGWFARVDTTAFKGHLDDKFTSGDGTFGGVPVQLGSAGLNWNISPKLDIGYRFEHGLGETKVGYRWISTDGSDPYTQFGPGGNISTNVTFQTIDLDWCTQHFNAEGLPFIFPLLKSWNRAGLGKPLTPNWFDPPLEMRWVWGLRGATFYYESVGTGPAQTERVMNNFNGAGLHFAIELNQRLRTDRPIFIHATAEGSGMWGFCDQTFTRTIGGVPETVQILRDGIGVPTATIELGLSYAPDLPKRTTKFTLAWQREQWFCFGNGGTSRRRLGHARRHVSQ
ncbi:MAG: hypothetical protein QM775_33505 [Pirellulales bacterium]